MYWTIQAKELRAQLIIDGPKQWNDSDPGVELNAEITVRKSCEILILNVLSLKMNNFKINF